MGTTRQRLITATNESFRHRGYHGTSVQAVVEAAEATVGSLYHFFPGGKSELAEATVQETGAAYGDLFSVFLAETASAEEAVRAFFHGAADALVESDFIDLCPIGTVAREVASEDERLRTAAADVFGQWVDKLVAPLVAVGIDAETARDRATAVICLLEGAFVLARTSRDAGVLRTTGSFAAAMIAEAVREASARRV